MEMTVNGNGKLRDVFFQSIEMNTKSKQSSCIKLNMSVCVCVCLKIHQFPWSFETVIVCARLYSVRVCACIVCVCPQYVRICFKCVSHQQGQRTGHPPVRTNGALKDGEGWRMSMKILR